MLKNIKSAERVQARLYPRKVPTFFKLNHWKVFFPSSVHMGASAQIFFNSRLSRQSLGPCLSQLLNTELTFFFEKLQKNSSEKAVKTYCKNRVSQKAKHQFIKTY